MLIIVVAITLLAYLFTKLYAKVKTLPPGPSPLPAIGNLHQMAWGLLCEGSVIDVMRKWQQEYGDVYTWWLGPLATVNICDYHVAYDAMVKKGANFASRPYLYIMDVIREGRGLISSNGQHWLEQRRFALQTMRNFGLGKNIMEDRVMLEFDYRTDLLNKEIENAGGSLNFNPYHFIELTIGNIINRILFSERFTDEKEEEFFVLKKAMDEMMENTNVFDFTINDRTATMPPFKQRLAMFTRPTEAVLAFIQGQIDQRKREIAEGKHILKDEGEDFVDAFFIQMQKQEKGHSFEEDALAISLLDLWFAGQETTTTTLYWALTYLLLNPEAKQKLQAELDSVTGRHRHLKLSDKTSTPYLNATITETLRLSSIVPFNLWREAAEDITIGDFSIPKGTAITAQLSLLLSDPKRFEDSKTFNPSRFLENSLEQYAVPFGMGKRACLGESLARTELYLLLGNLMLAYDFSVDEPHLPSMKPHCQMGAARRARPYHVVISKRD